ncbi:uncharacterized protein H6S33_007669 [Morchella sextelata]|uniref:uncharacterized protein n=1 Tax=Morchella sextelata TaxID=1174677 RepID=UPI001D0490C4|nr:uncharacterized protein H6S33_007669 [Morchella sextelata]KAH0603347.1 hypothetical protein H6S33_007669 [Morchella sextelata]
MPLRTLPLVEDAQMSTYTTTKIVVGSCKRTTEDLLFQYRLWRAPDPQSITGGATASGCEISASSEKIVGLLERLNRTASIIEVGETLPFEWSMVTRLITAETRMTEYEKCENMDYPSYFGPIKVKNAELS